MTQLASGADYPVTAESSYPAGAALRAESESVPLDWNAIGSHLARNNLLLDGAVKPRQLCGGLANLNYLFRVNGGWAVLRRPPSGPLPPGANDMGREHKILSRLWTELPLAPRSFHYCSNPMIAGAPFHVLEFRSGIAIRGDSLAPFEGVPGAEERLASMLIETLAAIHAVDLERAGILDLGKPEGFFRRSVDGWIKRAQIAVSDDSKMAAREIASWLCAVADPVPLPATMLHNDFKLDNVLIDPGTMKVVAVLDWDMGTRGDPLVDLTTMLSYWSEANDPDCMHRLAQMPTARLGFPTREAMAATYASRTGRSLAAIKPYRVLTMFKLGVVFHQLYARYRSGETTSPQYAGFGELGKQLHVFTRQIIEDKIF